ncbi:hypothetical protein [Candidatus Ferrigenium straubiae]|jgi:Tfp pilus assembly protein PilX|uniref:hypothetical protein n=1 Tax=Candidatus Ferrigenium straubiae TaxID=2919506 RepID=UPI003F4AE666
MRQHRPAGAKQCGAVLIVMLVIMVMGVVAILARSMSSTALQIERNRVTADALAQAKEALIGFSVSVNLSSGKRPGDLPCPDTDNDGIPGDTTYTTCNLQSQRIGRLPWKTLGLPDLRDGNGERLWYAVSTNFKNSTRSGTLNSDSPGTITVRSPDGNVIYDAAQGNGVAAVVIAPGDILQRQDGIQQDRGSAGINTARNYLDIANGIDNASFTDNTTNGFIQGRIRDGNDNLIVNDQLLVITQDNIMQAAQKRVAAEVRQCLNEYASNSQNNGRYPWAARLDSTNPVSYNDRSNRMFGRIPDTPFDSTKYDSNYHMDDSWTGNCNINSNSGWWLNWKEMVFYGLADAYKPEWYWWWNPACPTCLSVNPPSATADKKFVVIVAGKKLSGQSRSTNWDKGISSNYLEGRNANGATPFEQSPVSATFNDTVVFQ